MHGEVVQPPKQPVFNPVDTTQDEYRQACAAHDVAFEEYLCEEERYYRTTYAQWIREHPTEMTNIRQERLHIRSTSLWHREDQVMAYLRYAVTRGWGMLELYD